MTHLHTILLTADFNANELTCTPKVVHVLYFRQPGLNPDNSLANIFWVHHLDIVNIQKHLNMITAVIEVGVNQGQCEFKRDQECSKITVPMLWCVYETALFHHLPYKESQGSGGLKVSL